MSIYCTLPRRHPFPGITQSRTQMVSAEEARKLVDDLFNPIVEYDCEDTNDQNSCNPYERQNSVSVEEKSVFDTNYYQTNNSRDSQNMENNLSEVTDGYSTVTRSKSEHTIGLSSVVPTRSDGNHPSNSSNKSTNNSNNSYSNKNPETSYNSSTKLYYGFDNFEDFRRRRRSLAPDFYGGGMTANPFGTDSKHEFSTHKRQTIKSDSDLKLKKKNKYFTLPTRRSSAKNGLKDNVHEMEKDLTNGYNSKNNSNIVSSNESNYSRVKSLTNKLNSNPLQNVSKDSISDLEFHCCCRSGCHQNNLSNGNNHSNSGSFGLHCCQQMLETLWEEPITETSRLVRNRRSIAESMNSNSTNSGNGSVAKIETRMEMKDSELDRLRTTIDGLKPEALHQSYHNSSKHSSNANKVSLIRRHSISTSMDGNDDNSRISRQLSLESLSSVSSGVDGFQTHSKSKKKSKTIMTLNNWSSGWLRSSLSKAFKSHKKDVFSDPEIVANWSGNEDEFSTAPNSPIMSSRPSRPDSKTNESAVVLDLKRELREKEVVLTDLRLKSLTTSHQLENLKQTVNQLKTEIIDIKRDNDRLNRLVASQSLASSQSSMTSAIFGQNCRTTNTSTFFDR